MRTTTLGRSGPNAGVIGLGCMGMSFVYDMAALRDDHTSVAVIRQAIELGMTLFDTADAYGPYTNEVRRTPTPPVMSWVIRGLCLSACARTVIDSSSARVPRGICRPQSAPRTRRGRFRQDRWW
jgi:hypothetical protein